MYRIMNGEELFRGSRETNLRVFAARSADVGGSPQFEYDFDFLDEGGMFELNDAL
jgi:hypothetical protein